MAQQTAVEWLIEGIHKNMGVWIPTHIQEQAKAMEKEQIIDAANDVLAQQDSTYYGTPNLGEQYYNETYN
jgi:hypothetical protein